MTTLTREHLVRLMSRMTGDEKHSVAATSTLDVLTVLYGGVLDLGPGREDDPHRDRFLLSKGHGPMAYYAALAARGYFPEEDLDSFGQFSSPLGLHPDRMLVPGVEISSGSLGHGLPMAVGLAHGMRIQGHRGRVVVLVGDAELDEGSNAEAVEYAGLRALDALTVVAIDNHSSSYAVRGRIEQRFAVNGWKTLRVNGRDHAALRSALEDRAAGAPNLVVAEVENKK